MLSQLAEIGALFDELADKLAALRHLHAGDEDSVARLEAAERCAKRGAELTRSRDVPRDGDA
jgi:hypothetical protein